MKPCLLRSVIYGLGYYKRAGIATEPSRHRDTVRSSKQSNLVSVRPLLTPDNHLEHVLDLVEGAQDELLIRNQTFNDYQPDQDKLPALIQAVLAKQRAGVKVRVIMRLLDQKVTDLRRNLEALKERGFDMNCFKVLCNCHTKGIVVDRRKVLLGSQNWSHTGVSVNRDAGLHFDDRELAMYFANNFEHDWGNLVDTNMGRTPMPIESAAGAGTMPPGKVRLSWKSYVEMRCARADGRHSSSGSPGA